LAFIGRALLLLPAILLALFALPKFLSGRELDAAFPVPVYVAMNVTLPPRSYGDAAARLGRARDADGGMALMQAELLALQNGHDARVPALAGQGLSATPASARGWLVMAEAQRDFNPAFAARALGMALGLAPYDYWIAGRRAVDAARLYPHLRGETRAMAERQAQMLWDEPRLRPQLFTVLASPGGSDLVTAAFRARIDDLRALNRWVAAERRNRVRRQAERT
jgi:hypothetical protein